MKIEITCFLNIVERKGPHWSFADFAAKGLPIFLEAALDFNSEMREDEMKNFCETYDLINLISEPTCFKSTENPSCIDVMLTIRNNSFENSIALETGLSDFHKMTVTVMKKYYKKLDPITVNYRDYKSFDGDKFRRDLKNKVASTESLNLELCFKIVFLNYWIIMPPKNKN